MIFHPMFIIVLIVSLIIGSISKAVINNAYKKYSKIGNSAGYTGADIAKQILSSNNINNVSVNPVRGKLSDHYHPVKKQINLSQGVYNSNSIAAIGVASHECGHAIQYNKGYTPINIRNAILPVANIGSNFVWPLVIIGFFAQLPFLIDIGIIFFLATVLFHIITLPVEFDASRRAINIISNSGVFSKKDVEGSKKVLQAAAMTYVAATLISIVNLIYLLILRR